MTSEELIKHLRDTTVFAHSKKEVADHIEQLVATNEQLVMERDTIREAALREAAAECQTVLDNAKSFGLPQMAIGAAQCREVILALIGSK